MDISNKLGLVSNKLRQRELLYRAVLAAIVLLAIVLRLKGMHSPVIDHPGWRQGDTAAIARNFAQLEYNIFRPQTDYDGPPPNYVELELQIVPFIAATLYKLFGIHEIFGRLISIGFSTGTVLVLFFFGQWLFERRIAGYVAAFCYAVYPGSVYYGRTFTPDATMVFFLTLAVFLSARWIAEGAAWDRRFWFAALTTALAILAKPVAIIALVPILAAWFHTLGLREGARKPQLYAFLAFALAPYLLYDRYVASIAEWHWASGITAKHVLPQLSASFSSPAALIAKVKLTWHVLGMLPTTMLGSFATVLAVIAVALSARSRAHALLWGWLSGALAYAFAVVTVERVDYYLMLFLPLAALWTAGLAARIAHRRVAFTAIATACAIVLIAQSNSAVAQYYIFRYDVYRAARALDATLPPNALVVMGHYDPSILYYINRKGWEEDPLIWTPFDEESAIGKGARSFIAVEPQRLQRNVELYNWLARFPVHAEGWPVYDTDYSLELPGAEARWQSFRHVERTRPQPSPASSP